MVISDKSLLSDLPLVLRSKGKVPFVMCVAQCR